MYRMRKNKYQIGYHKTMNFTRIKKDFRHY